MREEEPEADQKVQNIQMNKKETLRKAAPKYHYNTYEYCTLQQQLSKSSIRQAKTKIIISN